MKKSLNKISNYLLWAIISFIIFVCILFISYIFRLGYLKIATYLLFFIILLVILINLYLSKGLYSTSFWVALFLIFFYGLANKYLRFHIILSRHIAGFIRIDPVILVNILYVIAFLMTMAFFIKFFIAEFIKKPDWIYLFLFAIFLKIIAIFSDFEFHNITEDYFEVFSLYFFSASFILASIAGKKDKK